MSTQQHKCFLNVKEAAEIARLSVWTIRKALSTKEQAKSIAAGKIPLRKCKVGSRVLIRLDELQTWLEREKTPSEDDGAGGES